MPAGITRGRSKRARVQSPTRRPGTRCVTQTMTIQVTRTATRAVCGCACGGGCDIALRTPCRRRSHASFAGADRSNARLKGVDRVKQLLDVVIEERLVTS